MGGISASLVSKAVMAIVCVGVNFAKHVFVIHGVDDVDKAAWEQVWGRTELAMPQRGPARAVTG